MKGGQSHRLRQNQVSTKIQSWQCRIDEHRNSVDGWWWPTLKKKRFSLVILILPYRTSAIRRQRLGAIELLGFDTSQLLMAATPCPARWDPWEARKHHQDPPEDPQWPRLASPLFQRPGVFPGVQPPHFEGREDFPCGKWSKSSTKTANPGAVAGTCYHLIYWISTCAWSIELAAMSCPLGAQHFDMPFFGSVVFRSQGSHVESCCITEVYHGRSLYPT